MFGSCGLAGADDFEALGARINQAMEDDCDEKTENLKIVIYMCKKLRVPFELKYECDNKG